MGFGNERAYRKYHAFSGVRGIRDLVKSCDEVAKLCGLTNDQKDELLAKFRWDYYLDDMAQDKSWGTELCIPAARDIWNLSIDVHNSEQGKWEAPYEIAGGHEIFLEYTGNHYNVLEEV